LDGNGKSPPDHPKAGFYKVCKRTVGSEEFKSLTPSARCLFHTLCELRNDLTNGTSKKKRKPNPDHRFWRWDDQLIGDAGLTKMTFRRARKALEEAGFVHVERRHGKSCIYTIADTVYASEMDRFCDSDALVQTNDDAKYMSLKMNKLNYQN
jgi:DNA-binding transcriptional ArsR family regulator